MIPQSSELLLSGFEYQEPPSRTFRLNPDTNTISGMVDGLEAVRQAIYLILHTERYEYVIYSWDYGVELKDLFGQPVQLVIPEIKRRITEALTQDSRITGVDAFSFETVKGKVHATFTVQTIYGDVPAESVVAI